MKRYAVHNHELLVRDYVDVYTFKLHSIEDIERAWVLIAKLKQNLDPNCLLAKQLDEIKDVLIRAEIEYHPDGA